MLPASPAHACISMAEGASPAGACAAILCTPHDDEQISRLLLPPAAADSATASAPDAEQPISECWADQASDSDSDDAGPRCADPPAAEVEPTPLIRRCSACQNDRERGYFSAKMWKRARRQPGAGSASAALPHRPHDSGGADSASQSAVAPSHVELPGTTGGEPQLLAVWLQSRKLKGDR